MSILIVEGVVLSTRENWGRKIINQVVVLANMKWMGKNKG